ncbi:hypothetical protein [Streptomyces sp. SDr-06]|uniref:hypothetical protein n=1 Tax=Streptomyces sp. SDr-06 TaxID=2267702 RepID=UPI001CB9075A|nr:hypothetical protein [Streptomyces sp. SDr-06]
MTAPALYEIETSEGDDGTPHPAEQLWTPCADGAADHGFIAHQGLFVAGIDGGGDDDLYPVGFLVLGHQRWADIIEAVAAYMARAHGWRNLHLYPGDDPTVLIPRIPRAVLAYGVFLQHPHPTHSCGCEWDDWWRLVWVPPTKPGVIPVTAMRHRCPSNHRMHPRP